MTDSVTPYIDGEPNRAAPLLVLLSCMFDGGIEFKDPAADFLANVLRSISDELEIIGAAGDDGVDRAPTLERCLNRAADRARLAVEIARRIQGGEIREPSELRGMVAATQGRPVEQ